MLKRSLNSPAIVFFFWSFQAFWIQIKLEIKNEIVQNRCCLWTILCIFFYKKFMFIWTISRIPESRTLFHIPKFRDYSSWIPRFLLISLHNQAGSRIIVKVKFKTKKWIQVHLTWKTRCTEHQNLDTNWIWVSRNSNFSQPEISGLLKRFGIECPNMDFIILKLHRL